MKWTVPYVDLPAQFEAQRDEILDALTRVMTNGSFILRDDVRKFEENMAEWLGVRHVIGVNSGTDALILAVRAAGVSQGDEVITVAHTFVGTLAAIHFVGATPVLVDIASDFNIAAEKIEEAVTPRTKAIIPVHLNGRSCDMEAALGVARKHNLIVIEDAAQALGAEYRGAKAGTFGYAGCFSLHPMKNLSCPGDGGFISCNDDELDTRLRMLRNHGQRSRQDVEFYGYSSRLDNLHAAVLNVKLPRLREWLKRRRAIASQYQAAFSDLPLILPPPPTEGSNDHYDVYSSYVIRSERQQQLVQYLQDSGIEAFVHFGPKTISEQTTLQFRKAHPLTNTENFAKQLLSLPVYPELTDEKVQIVIDAVRTFFAKV